MYSSPAIQALGFIGGTFDPVHYGHLRVALEFAEAFALPTVSLLPCYQSPHRDLPQASAQQRLAMLSLAVQHYPQLLVDARELERDSFSYTVDTLAQIRVQAGDDAALYFAMGADAFNGIEQWKNWQQLFELANIVVLHRPGYQASATHDFLLQRRSVFDGRHQRCGYWYEQPVTALGISATQIRTRAAKRQSLSFLLPEAVEHYIQQYGLYQPDTPQGYGH